MLKRKVALREKAKRSALSTCARVEGPGHRHPAIKAALEATVNSRRVQVPRRRRQTDRECEHRKSAGDAR